MRIFTLLLTALIAFSNGLLAQDWCAQYEMREAFLREHPEMAESAEKEMAEIKERNDKAIKKTLTELQEIKQKAAKDL
ncbi:MAG: hypothetical protein ACPF8V_03320, partial [Luteibaculum sp.]